MVVYLFLNIMNECFIFITFSFIKHVVWTNIFYIIHLFQAWLAHDENFLMFNILYHSLSFTSITHFVNGTGFSSFTRP